MSPRTPPVRFGSMVDDVEPGPAIELAFADEWGRIVASLSRRNGDWDLAEECAAQTFAEAVRRWPREGVPR